LDGVVYFPSSDGYLYAVYATTGNVIWQKNLTRLTKSLITIFSRTTPVVTKDLLLVAIYGPALMLAMDRKTGDIVWSTLLDPNPLAVLTMSGTVYKRYLNFSYQNFNCNVLYIRVIWKVRLIIVVV
jgi:outer membrane protein assembly factor BamB